MILRYRGKEHLPLSWFSDVSFFSAMYLTRRSRLCEIWALSRVATWYSSVPAVLSMVPPFVCFWAWKCIFSLISLNMSTDFFFFFFKVGVIPKEGQARPDNDNDSGYYLCVSGPEKVPTMSLLTFSLRSYEYSQQYKKCNLTLKWAHLPMLHKLATCSQTHCKKWLMNHVNLQLPTGTESCKRDLCTSTTCNF